MNILEAFLLGAIQGFAEFLPISSSGHLFLAQYLLGLHEVPLLFDIALHLATLLVVCILFRATIARLFMATLRFVLRKNKAEDSHNLNLVVIILIATVLTMSIGLPIDKKLVVTPQIVLAGFLVTSILLILSHIFAQKHPSSGTDSHKNTLKQSLIIGITQGIAVIPGISRSGSTISAALFAGMDRKTAGEVSFILSIPAILGGFLLHLKDLAQLSDTVQPLSLLVALLSATATGFISLVFLMKMVQSGRLYYFAFYLIPVAILGFIFIK